MYLQIIYNEKYIKLPGCDDLCEFSEAKKYIYSRIHLNVTEVCKNIEKLSEEYAKNEDN